MKKLFYFFVLLLFVLGCNQQQTQPKQNAFAPKVVEAQGYLVPQDSMSQPKVILVDEKKLKKIPVGKPKVVLTNTNIHTAINTNIHKAGTPKICIPGKDSFLLPKIVPALGTQKRAGVPEVNIAKDPHVNDNNPQSFSSFSKLQGLKHDVIRCMLQDKRGNLWFGTSGGGVSKYDGKSFTHFTDKEGLSNNTVFSILEDKSGNLWFGTDGGGVSKYDGKSFTHFTDKEGLSNNTVWSILEDKSGNLWFGTDGGGVSKYDGRQPSGGGMSETVGEFTHFTDKEGLSNNTVLSILEDKSGNLWFGTDGGGVSKYDGKSFTHFTDKEGLSNNTVFSILEDKSGNLWFGTDGGGVSKYDGRQPSGGGMSETVGEFTHFTDKEGLSNNTVLSILEDKSGNLWFGTDGGGVSKYDGKSFTHFTDKEGLSNNTVFSILEDKSGNLWFGTDGGGVSEYDGKSFTHFTDKEGLSNNTVRSILEDKSGNLWFGTSGGGVSKYDGKSFTHFTDKEGLSNNTVRSILEDKSGNLWFGTSGGVSKYDGKSFTHFTDKEGLSNNTVLSILEDKSGNLWFGTSGGVSKYDGRQPSGGGMSGTVGEFTHFTDKEGLSNNIVLSILEDKSGNLWFGTNGGGVSKYDGKCFTGFTDKEGLSNNSVWSILEDKRGNLWFGTRFGLSKMSKANLDKINDARKLNKVQNDEVLFKNYTFDDGFYGIGCNGGNSGKNILQDKNGTIWVAANDRLTAFHPEGDVADTIPPNIQLTSIALFNENIPWANLEHKKDTSIILGNGVRVGDFQFDSISKWYSLPENLSLAYNNNYLTFNYIGITQKQSKKVKYQYKLDGLDENWSGLTNRTDAAYGNLPHGNYTFKLKAMNSEGYWSNEYNYSFTIRPPWWKTWWAYTTYLVFVISAMVFIVWWNGKALRQRAIELAKEVKKATLEIRNQKEIVEEKNKEITDSINYAKRIQYAKLPPKQDIYSSLTKSFVLFKPKDIVSGDFYFFQKKEELIFIASADCTGHGVPGALMSMVGYDKLEAATSTSSEPSEILKQLNRGVKVALRQSGNDDSTRDGMDIAFCAIDIKNRLVKYAGANRPLWIIKNKGTEIEEIKATKRAIGGLTDSDQHFDGHELTLDEGDTIYLSTDGYADTFGGENGKKLTTKMFKQILLSIQEKTMQEQELYLDNFIESWKQGLEQVDDILVMGIRM